MAKLVDALSSGGSIRKVVLVRIQFRAQMPLHDSAGHFYLDVNQACLGEQTNKNASDAIAAQRLWVRPIFVDQRS